MQPEQIGLGISSTDSSKLSLGYAYGTTDNNGNVQSQTITVPGLSGALVQSYTYDSLNRLQSAQENSGTNWKQTYVYDRYGNRTFDAANTTLPNPLLNPSINSATNRLNESGYTYDPTGNVIVAPNQSFDYDGENRQVSFLSGDPNAVPTTYAYDGDGRRVQKVMGTAKTIFVYNASGQMVAEYSTQAPTTGGTSYLTSDNLGTPRVITDANGEVKSRHDYLPFGEEIASSFGNRSSVTDGHPNAPSYGANDNVNQKFTGKERDNETGLDFFEARYYSSPQGRFISVDPVTVTPERMADPQRLNLYAYVRNNPLIFTDSTGMIIDIDRLNKRDRERWEKIVAIANAKDKDGNLLHPKLNALYNKLQNDERTFYIQGGKLGSGSEAGRLEVETFKGENDFSAARITLDFDKIKNARVGKALFGDFKQFEHLRTY